MLAERSKKLEEHHEKLGAIIANLQIEKAKQVRLPSYGYGNCLAFLLLLHSKKHVTFDTSSWKFPKRCNSITHQTTIRAEVTKDSMAG